jgi:hypothetical protein
MRRTAAPPTDLSKSAQAFLFWRGEESHATKTKEDARDILKGWLTLKNQAGKYVNGRVDENGHRTYELPEPVTVGDVTYTGIQAQRKTSSSIDEDAVAELLRKKGGEQLYDLVFKRKVIRVFDEDQLFVLLQKGVLSEEELDEATSETESFALVPVKADAMLVEDE